MLIFYDNTDNIDNIRDTDVDIIVDIETPDRICSSTFAVDDISGLFYIHRSFLPKIQDPNK